MEADELIKRRAYWIDRLMRERGVKNARELADLAGLHGLAGRESAASAIRGTMPRDAKAIALAGALGADPHVFHRPIPD